MKRISLLKIMAFGVLALVHTACENAKYDVIDNLVYINDCLLYTSDAADE